MATKLKNMKLTSVDLVRAGANQEAHICLSKSDTSQEGAETPSEGEKNIFKRFIAWLRENPTEGSSELTDPNEIEKAFTTFDQINDTRESRDLLWRYTDALTCSIHSIIDDRDLDKETKSKMMNESLEQFSKAMRGLFEKLCAIQPSDVKADSVGKSAPDYDVIHEVSKAETIVEVEKYNSFHDENGRFASAPGGGGAVGGISHRTIAGGGISIHVKNGKEPKSGYMCATYTDRSTWLKGEDVTNPEKRTAAIKSFMEKNKDVLSDPDNYLGTWYDTSTGNISLDISRNFKSKSAAIKFATEHNEKAIWDVKNMAEISTGGTGNNI